MYDFKFYENLQRFRLRFIVFISVDARAHRIGLEVLLVGSPA